MTVVWAARHLTGKSKEETNAGCNSLEMLTTLISAYFGLALKGLVFSRSVMSDSLWPPWTAAPQASLSFSISWSLLKLVSIESVMPSDYLILCQHLLFLPSVFPSIRFFSSELALHIRWPRYHSFSFRISSSNEDSGLISFRFDCFDLLAVQGTVKGLLQHHSLKASVLQHSALFMVQLSHPCKLWLYRPLLVNWYLCFLIHWLCLS